jgi:hypothetical protein
VPAAAAAPAVAAAATAAAAAAAAAAALEEDGGKPAARAAAPAVAADSEADGGGSVCARVRTVRRPFARLRRLDLSGCEPLRPPPALLAAVPGLTSLRLAGTAVEDADVFLLASFLPRLRRLDLSGCTLVTDEGARALASAPALLRGRLSALGLGRLPRVTGVGFGALMAAWGGACPLAEEGEEQEEGQEEEGCSSGGVNACGCDGLSPSTSSSSSGSSRESERECGSDSDSDSDSDTATWCSARAIDSGAGDAVRRWQRVRRRRGGCGSGLWLDVGGSSAVDGCVLSALLQATAERRSGSQWGGTAAAPPGRSGGRQARCDSSKVEAGRAAAEEAAEFLASLGLFDAEEEVPQGQQAARVYWRGHKGEQRRQQRPRRGLQLRALLASGCRLGPDDLLALSRAGCLRHLQALDLSHCEPLRKPAAACLEGASFSAGHGGDAVAAAAALHPVVALLAPPPLAAPLGAPAGGLRGPRALRVLRLDAVHLTDAAATAIARAVGPALRELSLVACRPLGTAGLRAFGSHCARLRSLSIGGGGPRAWDEAAAFAGAPALAGLTRLAISRRSGLTDAALAALLATAPRLSALRLAGCYGVSDRGLARAPGRLRDLSLVGLDRAFTGACLARLPALRRLRLSGCPGVTGPALQLVVVCCPQLAELALPGHLARIELPAARGGGFGGGRAQAHPRLRVEVEP